jgi:hypothetical protein
LRRSHRLVAVGLAHDEPLDVSVIVLDAEDLNGHVG